MMEEHSKPTPIPKTDEEVPWSEEDKVSDGLTGLIKEIRDIIDKAGSREKRVNQCAYGIIAS